MAEEKNADSPAPPPSAADPSAAAPLEPLPATAFRPQTAQSLPPEEEAQLLFEFTDERKFQLYAERRKGYSEAAREAYARFHQTIIGLSAGAVILSVTFSKDIGRVP